MRSIAVVILVIGVIASYCDGVAAQKKVVCYLGSWSAYRPGNGKFEVENIDTNLCTHAIYSFIGLNTDGTVRIMDSWLDISLGGFQRFNNLRQKNANLKTLVAIGGWNEGSTKFSTVTANPTLRAMLVTNLYNFVKQYGFNGLDLDWEYPAQRGGAAADKQNLVSLVKELRAKFAPEGLLLTAAVGAGMGMVATSYSVSELAANLDFINLMTYDYHGSWETITGHNAPLYAATTDQDKQLNVDASVQYWIQQGAPAAKLVLGIGLYGRSFTLKSATSAGMGAPSIGAGTAGPYTQEAGFLGYNEICEMQRSIGWTIRWHTQQQVAYANKGTLWVGYDSIDSVRIKADYARTKNLGGVMVWSIETDDFRNICGAGAYPLLSQIKTSLG